MSSTLIRRLLLALLVLGLLGAGIWWAKRTKPVAVLVTTIDQGRVESSIANTRAGTVEACMRTKLSATMGGRIEVLAVKEGDKVKKGQLLMKLWNDDQQAQSSLAMAQVETARKRVVEACTVAANAEREAERQTTLFKQGFISGSRDEQARSEAQARRAGCDAAKADVAQTQARVNATRVEQNRTVLYAPFAGTVAKIVGEVGEYSTPSPPGVPTPPAIDLIDDTCLYVRAPMDEVDAPKISAGQTVRISFDALPKQSFPGKVKRVAPYVSAVEKQARTVDIEATLDIAADKTSPRLLVGYSADVEVVLALRESVVRVPTSALQEGGRVLLAGADGTLQERKLKTGLANWEYTEVLEGLAAGDKVVTSLEREGVKPGAHFVVDEKQKK
ncbi:efflux RND transporter periplasmic adaptor subunit [Rhodoferax sp. AJA081-3]|uniref:efflux RND transporter periplasmic adaptor subunit n=1 Tax=Rhodoferax sp. AJA081-3 TaxID=2752316 RepID=UPI001BB6AE33|nr:efflux RND transporter periplasmic adaptor subunit [Rhodoferax sp. AJA081-3]QTN27562.1 efflux RND transporter periplasmic adaptor subunit [Rhodoferax sp. AJA081-3]